MLRPYATKQHDAAMLGYRIQQNTGTTKAKKMILAVIGLIGALISVNFMEAGGIIYLHRSLSVRRVLCEDREGVLNARLSSMMSAYEIYARRYLCEWDTPLEDESYRDVFEQNTTYDSYDPNIEYPDTTIAFVISIPSCPDSGDVDDPGAAFYDAAAVLKDSICNNTDKNPGSGSQYNATMYAIVHPDAVFCTAPTPQDSYSSSVDRRALSSTSSYDHDRVKILQELGFWVIIWGEPSVRQTSRDLMPLYAYNFTQHSVAVMMKFDTIILDKLDGLFDSFLGSNDAKSYYQLDENGLVYTGILFAKPDSTEFDSILDGYQNDNSYTGGANAAEYLTHHFSSNNQAYIVQDFSLAAVSFGFKSACGKPWQCYYNATWDTATHDACLLLNNAWFSYRSSFETRWSKQELVNTSLGTYHPNFFLGYCYEGGSDGYQRAADYSPVLKYTCPTLDGETIDLGSSARIIELESSMINSLCTLTKVMTDNSTITPFPIARSYESNDWEAAAGPTATSVFAASPITCENGVCRVNLPSLTAAKYVLTTYNYALTPKNEAARFLEKTSFGQTREGIDNLLSNVGILTDVQRATFVQNQMSDIPITSHREYWRKRTNPKWMFPTINGRSDHPCSPNSMWRRYTFTRFDRYGDLNTYHPFYVRYLEDYNEPIIAEAEDAIIGGSFGDFRNDEIGFTGTGYRRIYRDRGPSDIPALEWTITIKNDAGFYPLSFRYATGDTGYSFPGHENHPYDIVVNNNTIEPINFLYTEGWNQWHYTDTVLVDLNEGNNTIQMFLGNVTPSFIHVDHLRIGLERRAALEVNGHVMTVVDGIKLGKDFAYQFKESTPYYHRHFPIAPCIRYERGRTILTIENTTVGKEAYRADIGNPPVDFTGYEQEISNDWFDSEDDPWFTLPASGPDFVENLGQIEVHQLLPGQEMQLVGGLNESACARIPSFAEWDNTPVFGRQPDGTWYVWTPSLKLEENTPSSPVPDGGGEVFVETDEKTMCMNPPRTWLNEESCILSNASTACKTSETLSGTDILLDEESIISFYNLTGTQYVYAIKGLPLEGFDGDLGRKHNPCVYEKVSRWEIADNTTCVNPTVLGSNTMAALNATISDCSDPNPFIKDCPFGDMNSGYYCDSGDEDIIYFELQIGTDCYTLVNPDHMNVYDVTGWARGPPDGHNGGAEKITKWAEGGTNYKGEPYPGWYLIYPSATYNVTVHPLWRWEVKSANTINFKKIGRFGDTVKFRDLPNDLRTREIAELYGADPEAVAGSGVVVCGSIGEVSNDKSLGEQFNLQSNSPDTSNRDEYNQQKAGVWYNIALSADDQLRQRAAWALSQILVVVPDGINAVDKTEIYLNYYDIFVRHAFGNYLDILKETSYSPLMAEHLSFLDSKSHAYIFDKEDKRVAFADENFAREVMQLFSVGLNRLNDDGTPKLDSNGQPLQVYTNNDIMSFARAWTGFRRQAARGNIEEDRSGSTDNRLDPMNIEKEWRDRFPKSDLIGGYIGDRYPLCADLPAKMFLRKGSTYRLLGGNPLPELMPERDTFYKSDTKRLVLNATASSLYNELSNGGTYQALVTLQSSHPCTGEECLVDTVRVVKVDDVYYEYKQAPCVQQAFYNGGKKIENRWRHYKGTTCANPALPHAGEACCDGMDRHQVSTASRNYVYENERMTYATAEERCGGNLCEYRQVQEPGGDTRKTHFHWTNVDCFVQAKIDGEGMVAIVHDAPNLNTLPLHISEESLNYFSVYWDGGIYPAVSNNCGYGSCKALQKEEACVCQAYVENSQVFADAAISNVDEIIASLKIGHTDPNLYDDGLYAEANHTDSQGMMFTTYLKGGAFDEETIFKVVDDKGRTLFLKNVMSTVKLQGWTAPPMIIEGEAQETYGYEVKNSDRATPAGSGQYVDANGGRVPGAYIDWKVEAPVAGQYKLRIKYAHNDANSDRPQNISVNGITVDSNFGFPIYTSDWTFFRYSKYLTVTLNAGNNTIRTKGIEAGYSNAPNFDHIRVEGLTTNTSYSFPNPVHFMGLIKDQWPYGIGETNLRDAQYETDAVLEHYFYDDNVAPFLCIRFIQRFGVSNPSPRYVRECSLAFKSGLYSSGGETFGSGKYGDLKAAFAAVILDREATSVILDVDPSSGSIREPLLKVVSLMRSMNYTKKPNEPVIDLWKLEDRFGQAPFEFPTVFSFFLPEYIPPAGPAQVTSLTAPESGLVDLPKTLELINGMFSLIKYGLSDCLEYDDKDYGLGRWFGFGGCQDDGVYERAAGFLNFVPSGTTISEEIDELSTLLTAGRLSSRSKQIIEDAITNNPDAPLPSGKRLRLAQQLIVTSGEFHSTTTTKPDLNNTRSSGGSGSGSNTTDYKAVVYLWFGGGCDSYNMLAPHTCPSTGLWEKYVAIRENVALFKNTTDPSEENILEIPANNAEQPCDSFGIHSRLPILKSLYDQNETLFVANAGVLAKPVNVSNYKGETPVQLFAHNAMTKESGTIDVYEEIKGTGVLGRLSAAVNSKDYTSGAFSISGNQIALIGQPGQATPLIALSYRGMSEFNPAASAPNMTEFIKGINGATLPTSSFMSETWSSELFDSLVTHDLLYNALQDTSVTATFPRESFADQLKMVTRLMQTRHVRDSNVDLFYVSTGGYDTHSSVKVNLEARFDTVNAALESFIEELKNLNLWDNVVIAQFSEFARTLNPNSGAGTDHAWGGNHFVAGGKVNGGKVIGHYPDEFVTGLSDLALSRGRMIPTTPWDATWQGICEWIGLTDAEIDEVLPMRENFDPNSLFDEATLFKP